MSRLNLDDLQVDSFATSEATVETSAAVITVGTAYPYSLLGSCYGCPGNSDVTICPASGYVAY